MNIVLVLFIILLVMWAIMGLFVFVEKYEYDTLPKGFENNFYFHLKGGPVSWLLGIGRMMYYIMNGDTDE